MKNYCTDKEVSKCNNAYLIVIEVVNNIAEQSIMIYTFLGRIRTTVRNAMKFGLQRKCGSSRL